MPALRATYLAPLREKAAAPEREAADWLPGIPAEADPLPCAVLAAALRRLSERVGRT